MYKSISFKHKVNNLTKEHVARGAEKPFWKTLPLKWKQGTLH